MRTSVVILVLLLSCFQTVHGQEVYNSSGRRNAKKPSKKQGFDIDRLVLGGDARFTAASGFSVGLAPMAGLKLVDNFFGGVRLGYSYDRLVVDRNSLPAGQTSNVFTQNAYSGGLWLRYLLFQTIFVHTEMQYNFYERYAQNETTMLYEKRHLEAPSLLIGLGVRQPVSDRLSLNFTALYDVLNSSDPASFYQGGLDLRVGMLVGF